jgi:hypothetical protein
MRQRAANQIGRYRSGWALVDLKEPQLEKKLTRKSKEPLAPLLMRRSQWANKGYLLYIPLVDRKAGHAIMRLRV